MLVMMVAPGEGDVKAKAKGTRRQAEGKRQKAKGKKIESRLTNHDSRLSECWINASCWSDPSSGT
jgi:hypothetical protein